MTNRYRFDAENHIHLLDGRPLHGTSTVCQVISKPLTYWAAGKALEPLGWRNKKKSTLDERRKAAEAWMQELAVKTAEEYAAVLEFCYHAHRTKKEAAAVTGSDMHGALERYCKECIEINSGVPVLKDIYETPEVERFAKWAVESVEEFCCSEAHCFSERLWVGGICDCVAWLKSEEFAIIDFKSSREAYFSHFVQTGGYAVQIFENGGFTSEGERIFATSIIKNLIIYPFGTLNAEPVVMSNVKEYMEAFESAVCIHKLQQKFET